MNTLENLAQTLASGANPITVDEDIRRSAWRSVQRMVEFARANQVRVHGTGNA